MHLRWLVRRREQHRLAIHRQHRVQLQARGRDRLPVGQQAPRVVQVATGEQNPRRGAVRQAIDQRDPGIVALLRQQLSGTRRRVDAEDLDVPLVTRLHRGVRAESIPARPGQVLERRGVPAHPGELATRRRRHLRDPEAHRCVRCPRRRVAEAGRRAGRVRRIGDVPALHLRRVHPRNQQPLTVRCPPVASIAPHLLSRHMLRQPEANVRRARRHHGVRPGYRPVCGAVCLNHSQGAPADVGDAPPRGIRARIDHRLRCREPADRGSRGTDRPELPGEGEDQ